MRYLIILFIGAALISCTGKKDIQENQKERKDTVISEPENFESAHERDKKEFGIDSLKEKKQPERVKF